MVTLHYRFTRTAENVVIESESVAEDPNVSIHRQPQELGLSHYALST